MCGSTTGRWCLWRFVLISGVGFTTDVWWSAVCGRQKNIDYRNIGSELESSQLHESPNLGEFSGVLWSPATLLRELESGHTLSAVRRFHELTEWVKEGNIIVIVGPPRDHLKVDYVDKRIPHSYDFLANEIFSDITFRHTSGSLVEYCGPDNLSQLIGNFASAVSYNAIISGQKLVPLFRVSQASTRRDQIVGAFKPLGNGMVVFLPWLSTSMASEITAYYAAALSIPEYLNKEFSEQGPDWLSLFQTSAEQEANEKIKNAHSQILKIEAEIVKLKRAIFLEQSAKILFTGTGDAFANAVAEALRELGLKVIEGPKHRADLIAWDGKRLAAIEAKGIEGPAREKNIAQAVRWAADIAAARLSTEEDAADDIDLENYRTKLADLGVPIANSEPELPCKGIVILGTFRKTPIDERSNSFNDPVVRVINRSGICALTGLQLFNILREVRAELTSRNSAIDKIFGTNGVLDLGHEWQGHLNKVG